MVVVPPYINANNLAMQTTLSVADAADLIGTSRATTYRHVGSGLIPSVEVNGVQRVQKRHARLARAVFETYGAKGLREGLLRMDVPEIAA